MASASVFQSDSLESVMATARRLRREEEVSRIDLYSPSVSAILQFPPKYHVIVTFRSDRGKIKGESFVLIAQSNERAQRLLASRGYFGTQYSKLFFDQLHEFFSFLESHDAFYFGRLDTGVIYPFFPEGDRKKSEATMHYVKSLQFDTRLRSSASEPSDARDVPVSASPDSGPIRSSPLGRTHQNSPVDPLKISHEKTFSTAPSPVEPSRETARSTIGSVLHKLYGDTSSEKSENVKEERVDNPRSGEAMSERDVLDRIFGRSKNKDEK